MRLSTRITDLQESPIRKLIPYAQKAKASGIKVYHLNIGQPDIPTPPAFLDEIKSIDASVVPYQLSTGDPTLIDAICKNYQKEGIDLHQDEMIITNGGSEALMFALSCICDPYDEILLPEPFYANYKGFLHQTMVQPVGFMTTVTNQFHLPCKEEITKLITDRTKAIMITNPGNPTGTVYTEEELQMILSIAKEFHLFVICDEVYRKIVFDQLKSPSLLSFHGYEDNVIIIDSVSKRFSCCGARIGAVITKNKQIIKGALKLAQTRLSVSTVDQIGARRLYELDEEYAKKIKEEYEQRRNVCVALLKKIPSITYSVPQGAFYTIVSLPFDADDYCKWLLETYRNQQETVMFAPAKDFYNDDFSGKNQIRLAFVLNQDDLRRALTIFKESITEYMKKKG